MISEKGRVGKIFIKTVKLISQSTESPNDSTCLSYFMKIAVPTISWISLEPIMNPPVAKGRAYGDPLFPVCLNMTALPPACRGCGRLAGYPGPQQRAGRADRHRSEAGSSETAEAHRAGPDSQDGPGLAFRAPVGGRGARRQGGGLEEQAETNLAELVR